MNPTTDQQPPRSSFGCDRHPVHNFTGFCSSCLRERLTILDHEEQQVTEFNDLEKDIVEMEAEIDAIVDNLKTINDHIHLDARPKKPSFSSIFSKRWLKWRQKPKNKSTSPVEKPISRKCRETQTEIADYGFGRRSCDVDPRFSLDEPRASWDGHSIGRTFPRLPPISRFDTHIPVEEAVNVPGGSTQTREYYLDSSSWSSKRRKSLERSNSIPTNAHAKVSPATLEYVHSRRRLKFQSIGGDRELAGDLNSLDMGFRDNAKKSRWWKIWGQGAKREDRKVCRSNSSVSWRNWSKEESGLERNRSSRSNHMNNGLLRFYLTPLRGSRRTDTNAKNMVRLY